MFSGAANYIYYELYPVIFQEYVYIYIYVYANWMAILTNGGSICVTKVDIYCWLWGLWFQILCINVNGLEVRLKLVDVM